MKLNDLLRKTTRVDVTYGGETFGVDFLPHALTTDVQVKLKALIGDGLDESAALNSLFVLLPTLVSGWEIEDDDGSPLPVTEETLRRFPILMLAEIATAITGSMDPNRTTTRVADETPSSSGASRPALSVLLPTGTS